ncbi:MAG: hypothetical protein KH354_00140 [Clostridiales bacterium]|nr:hypothetical protein [Clostridiales bacterium]
MYQQTKQPQQRKWYINALIAAGMVAAALILVGLLNLLYYSVWRLIVDILRIALFAALVIALMSLTMSTYVYTLQDGVLTLERQYGRRTVRERTISVSNIITVSDWDKQEKAERFCARRDPACKILRCRDASGGEHTLCFAPDEKMLSLLARE